MFEYNSEYVIALKWDSSKLPKKKKKTWLAVATQYYDLKTHPVQLFPPVLILPLQKGTNGYNIQDGFWSFKPTLWG